MLRFASTFFVALLCVAGLAACDDCDDCAKESACCKEEAPAANAKPGAHCVLAPEADEEGEQVVALAGVPPKVIEAAKAAMPGFTPTGAEKEIEHGVTVYDITGTAGGKTWEIEVSADGRVLEKELEDGDDPDDATDDGDD